MLLDLATVPSYSTLSLWKIDVMKSFAPKLQAKSQENDAKARGGLRGGTPSPLAEHHSQAAHLSSLQAMADRSPKVRQLAGLQAIADNSPRVQAQAALQRRADERRENRTGMPDQLKNGLEQLSGMDLSDVRVHRNSSKPAQLNALAYAQGRDIHLGPGQERHLPHEGWHVVQQAQGRVRPTAQAKGEVINDDVVLEREADVMGGRASEPQETFNSRKAATRETLLTSLSSRSEQYRMTSVVQGFFANATRAKYQHAVVMWQEALNNFDNFDAALNAAAGANNARPTMNTIRDHMDSKAERAGGTLLGEAYESRHWAVALRLPQFGQRDRYDIDAPGGPSGIDVRRYHYTPAIMNPATGGVLFGDSAGGGTARGTEVKSAGTLATFYQGVNKAIQNGSNSIGVYYRGSAAEINGLNAWPGGRAFYDNIGALGVTYVVRVFGVNNAPIRQFGLG